MLADKHKPTITKTLLVTRLEIAELVSDYAAKHYGFVSPSPVTFHMDASGPDDIIISVRDEGTLDRIPQGGFER